MAAGPSWGRRAGRCCSRWTRGLRRSRSIAASANRWKGAFSSSTPTRPHRRRLTSRSTIRWPRASAFAGRSRLGSSCARAPIRGRWKRVLAICGGARRRWLRARSSFRATICGPMRGSMRPIRCVCLRARRRCAIPCGLRGGALARRSNARGRLRRPISRPRPRRMGCACCPRRLRGAGRSQQPTARCLQRHGG